MRLPSAKTEQYQTEGDTVRAHIRLPADTYQQIKAAAAAADRSINAELVARIEQSLSQER